jgi:hypothetical protein
MPMFRADPPSGRSLYPGARSSVVEHPTFNRMVDGSNPSGRTNKINDLGVYLDDF